MNSKIVKNLKNLFLFIRPVNVAITFLSSLVASILCSDTYGGAVIIFAAISAGITAASGNVINDVMDSEGDKINHPERPIPSGIINKQSAVNFYLFLTTISLFITASISIPLLLINSAAVLILLFYSIKLKNIVLLGNLTVSMLTGLVFIFGGEAAGDYSLAIIPAIFAFLINMIREIVKDIQDIDGDLKVGTITFPAKYGTEKTKLFTLSICVLLFIASLLPIIFNIYSKIYGYLIIILFEPILIYIILLISKKENNLSLKNISFLLKLNMIIGLTALYFGR